MGGVDAERLPDGGHRRHAAFSLGAVAGFPLGGWLTEVLSWRMTYATGAVVVAAALLVLRPALPQGGGSGRGRFDLKGAVLLGVASLTVLGA
jgi:predicted MFS family arabinose efflux permease